MKQFKVWSGFTIFWVWLLLSLNTYAGNNLPDFTELVAEQGAAVVNISTTKNNKGQRPNLPPGIDIPEGTPFDELFKHFFGAPGQRPQPYESHSLGSGFVLSSDGYILTNHHVIKDADEIIVRFSDRSELEAKVLGSDERSDVALLKVEAIGLKAVKLGDSTKLKVGEWVLAIGSPFGFDYSATAGIVSALGRSLPSDSYVPFIQTDVAINPGNSGGPLFNLNGEVIGINSQIYSRTGGFMGLSFAIPMDVVMNVVAQIKSQGYVSRGWLGVVIQDVTRELAESFGLDKPHGALISRVLDDSPAAKAGFEPGDVILKFNGKKIATSSDLPPIVGRTEIGKSVPVVIMRNNKRKTVNVKVEQLPETEDLAKAKGESGRLVDERLAIEVADLDDRQREQYGIEKGGVAVVKVEQGSAGAAGIRRGDVILSIDNQKISDAKQFLDIAKELPENKAIPVLVQRGEGAIFLALRIEKND
ncbi:MAG: DegQ family serine endoprotease [Gammaproteobacteria bacterium]|nr:DegQ family serine endoprotease [Gammaproteobacteria bacterium]MDH5591974.1 DegQ family serine endoprotease [Gammaproteobacteria bacterium]